jgi:predicted nucleic acid-binding protein
MNAKPIPLDIPPAQILIMPWIWSNTSSPKKLSGSLLSENESSWYQFTHLDEWLSQSPAVRIVPTDKHWSILKELILPLGTAANLISDAHLAALAIEHGARLYSTDNDFSRFPNLRWTNPIY